MIHIITLQIAQYHQNVLIIFSYNLKEYIGIYWKSEILLNCNLTLNLLDWDWNF